jgi:hypothetical protein
MSWSAGNFGVAVRNNRVRLCSHVLSWIYCESSARFYCVRAVADFSSCNCIFGFFAMEKMMNVCKFLMYRSLLTAESFCFHVDFAPVELVCCKIVLFVCSRSEIGDVHNKFLHVFIIPFSIYVHYCWSSRNIFVKTCHNFDARDFAMYFLLIF